MECATAPSIQAVAPTLAALAGLKAPDICSEGHLESVSVEAGRTWGREAAEKVLVFCPDALGLHLFRHQPSMFGSVLRRAPLRTAMKSVVPSYTPVCFASMFTGAAPRRHGITRYEKPVLTCDTLFDALIRAGKKVAIVAVADSSIDRIFRGREIDYFSEKYDQQVTSRCKVLLERGVFDFILAYQQEYDDTMHATTPFDEKAVAAAHRNIESFGDICDAFDRSWSAFHRAILFAPDHGAHVDQESHKGAHGKDIEEDMCLYHYYGLRRGAG